MPSEMAFGDEPGERVLRQDRAMPVCILLCGDQRMACPMGRDDVAQAQRGKKALGEGSDIENTAGVIQRLQRVERTPAVAKLAVVIILDDDRVTPPCQLE